MIADMERASFSAASLRDKLEGLPRDCRTSHLHLASFLPDCRRPEVSSSTTLCMRCLKIAIMSVARPSLWLLAWLSELAQRTGAPWQSGARMGGAEPPGPLLPMQISNSLHTGEAVGASVMQLKKGP